MKQMKRLKQIHVRIPFALANRLAERAKEEEASGNEIVNKALAFYFERDVADESLLIAMMSETQRLLQTLDRRVDVAQKLQLEWYQQCLMFAPSTPQDKKEAALLYKTAAERAEAFLANFRRRLPNLPSLLEALLADFLEEDF
jgi:hypothetical protein